MGRILEWARQVLDGEAPPPPVAELVGFRMTSVGEGRSTFEFEATEQHANPMGTLHGGILCDVADAAMGMAFASLLEEADSFTTLELSIHFLRPFWTGMLYVEAEVVSKGRSVGMVEARVHDEQRRLIAKTSCTQMVLAGERAEGR